MPPPSSKKGSAGPKPSARDRRSASRHSTPVSALTDTTAPPTPLQSTPSTVQAPVSGSAVPKETPYTHTPTATLLSTSSSDQITLESLIDRCNANGKNELPSARALHELESNIRESLVRTFVKRGETANASMRQLVQRRKERERAEREVEAARAEEAEAGRVKREKEERKKAASGTSKKRAHEEMEGGDREGSVEEGEEERKKRDAPSVGAHGLARQDGVGVHQAAPPPPSPPIEPGTAAIDPMDTAESPSDADVQQQEPASTAPLYERAFGKDPTQFDDPTIYDIRPISQNMTEDEIRDILNVATWPKSDLRDLTAGDPPDQDFSNAKPANQVNFSTFQSYVEPYIRPYTEEDVAFLKERGDRFVPYIIPNRGPKGYKEIWAAEDGLMGVDPPKDKTLDPNEPRGSLENMDDSVAETDEVSVGPLTSRLLSLLRPVPNTSANGNKSEDNQDSSNKPDANGDTEMSDLPNGTSSDPTSDPTANPLQTATPRDTQPKPTTHLPPTAPRPTNLPNPDFPTYEARALAELRYIGFLPPTQITPPDYSAALDDEVSARLRTLQHALREVSARNNLRRQRVLELTYERMAMQEYANIADDLDNQVNAAYLKRNRNLAKPAGKKGAAARAAQGQQKGVASAAGTGVGGRGVSEGVKALMEKRGAWRGMIGGVVGFGRQPILGDEETVFGEEDMRRAEVAERELEAGEEGEG